MDLQRFQFIADALNRTGGFSDGTYLIQHPREGSARFAARVALASYVNFLRRACGRFVGYLAMRPTFRDTQSPVMTKFAWSCNWADDSLDVFFLDFMSNAKARGSMLLLVDMPSRTQMEDGARTLPYLAPIYPETIKKYRLNPRGDLAEITFTEQVQDKTGRAVIVERTYTETGWKFTGGEADEGSHDLGVCPVIAFTESGAFPAEGEFGVIADLSLDYFNLQSELRDLLRSQVFSILKITTGTETTQADGSQSLDIGTHNALVLSPGSDAGFITPPKDSPETYEARIKATREMIAELGYEVDAASTNFQESGYAKKLRFQALNSSLVHFARRMEDFERKMWWIVGRWLKTEAAVTVSWGKDFNIADLATEIEVAQNMAALNAPPEYARAKLKQLAQLDLGTLPSEEFDLILNAVDDMALADPPADPLDTLPTENAP